MGVLAAAGAAYSGDPFAGAAVLASAGKVLRDLWKQSRTEMQDSSQSPYRVLLRLGIEKARFGRVAPPSHGKKAGFKGCHNVGPYHWLCPPTGGIRAAVMREEDAKNEDG